VAGGAKQEDATDDEAINRCEADEEAHDTGMWCRTVKKAAGRGGHQRIHDEQPSQEHAYAARALGDAAEIGCEEEECELAGCLCAKAMDDADTEGDRAGIVEIAVTARVDSCTGRPDLAAEFAVAADDDGSS